MNAGYSEFRQNQQLFLLILIDSFLFPYRKGLGIRLSDLHADCVDGLVKLLLDLDPVLADVFRDWHLWFLESKLFNGILGYPSSLKHRFA